jgi:GR25 family glycosyltransferase involved in LPS biosynthesis
MSEQIILTSIPTFYINLDDRTDRKESIEKLLKDLEFENFERFPAVKKKGRSIGCSTSHANVLKHIAENNIYPALILEDDVSVFEFESIIKYPEDADAMYIGFSKYGYSHNPEDDFPRSLKIREFSEKYHRVQNMLARHAVIHFNLDYDLACIDMMEDFLSDPEKYVAGDIALAKMNPDHKVYCKNTPVFYQNDAYTRKLTKHPIYCCDYVDLDKV